MTSSPTPETAAAGLSEAQKKALLTGRAEGRGKWPLRNSLVARGLAMSWPFALTELGYQVRAHLQGSSK